MQNIELFDQTSVLVTLSRPIFALPKKKNPLMAGGWLDLPPGGRFLRAYTTPWQTIRVFNSSNRVFTNKTYMVQLVPGQDPVSARVAQGAQKGVEPDESPGVVLQRLLLRSWEALGPRGGGLRCLGGIQHGGRAVRVWLWVCIHFISLYFVLFCAILRFGLI